MSWMRRLSLLILTFGVLAGLARAGDDPALSLRGELDAASKYSWRGYNYNEDPILTSTLSLGYRGFDLTVRAIFDSSDYWGREHDFSELHYILSYTHAFSDDLSLTGGVLIYDFPGRGDQFKDEAEVFASVAHEGLPLRPRLTVYYDYGTAFGWMVILAGRHSLPLAAISAHLSLDLESSVGWLSSDYAEFLYGVNRQAWTTWCNEAALTYRATPRLTLACYARADYLLDRDARAFWDDWGPGSTTVLGGVRVAYRF